MLNIQTGDEPASERPADEFLGRARQARHPSQEQRRGAVHGPVGQRRAAPARTRPTASTGRSRFYDNLAINTYWARTHTDGLGGDDVSYRGQLDYTGDRYGVQLERLVVGDELQSGGRIRPAPRHAPHFGAVSVQPAAEGEQRAIRKYFSIGSIAYIENGAGRLETRDVDGEFAIEFQNQDRFRVGYSDTYEFLPEPFAIAPGVTLPVGGYDFSSGGRLQLWAQRAGSRATCRSSTARSTTATRRRLR